MKKKTIIIVGIVLLTLISGTCFYVVKYQIANQLSTSQITQTQALAKSEQQIPNTTPVVEINEKKDDYNYFKGAINNRLDIHLKFKVEGNKLTGSYYYDKYKTDILINGEIDKVKNVSIEEYDTDRNQTGKFDGIYVSDDRIEGIWFDKKSSFPFYLELENTKDTIIKNSVQKDLWNGVWTRVGNTKVENASVQIHSVTDRSFYFYIKSTNGVNVGEVDGFAIFNKDCAVFKDERGAEMKFYSKQNSIEVTANEKMSSYGGVGVSFSGNYVKCEIVNGEIKEKAQSSTSPSELINKPTLSIDNRVVKKSIANTYNHMIDYDLRFVQLTGTYKGINVINEYYSSKEKGDFFGEERSNWFNTSYPYDQHFSLQFYYHADVQYGSILSISGGGNFWAGGVNNPTIYSDVFDLNTGKKLTLSDIFKISKDEYLNLIYNEVAKGINKEIAREQNGYNFEDAYTTEGKAAIEKFQPENFYLTGKSLVVFYPKYSLGIGAAGTFIFDIPLDSIKDKLKIDISEKQLF